MRKRIDGLVGRIFLGPGSTFRNPHRDWLYVGYLMLIGVVFAVAALRG